MLAPLKPSELGGALLTCFKAGRAPMVHGDPGIGKSEVVEQIADSMFAEAYGYKVGDNGELLQRLSIAVPPPSQKKVRFEYEPVPYGFVRPWFRDVRAALLDPVDVRGLPHINKEGRADWAVPAFIPTDERGGIIFFDEINRGTEMVQNSLFQYILSNRIGEAQSPKSWVSAAAVNDNDAGARKMSGALRARFVHLQACTDLQDVLRFAVQKDWDPMVIAFLQFRPELLHAYNQKEQVSPNPRAWAFVSQLVQAGLDPRTEVALVSGVVGEGAAIEFCAFLRLYSKCPSIDAILLDPGKADVPTEPQMKYAVASALSRRANANTIGRIVSYLDRMPVEFNVMAVTHAVYRDKSLQQTPDFNRWSIKHDSVVF